MRLVLSIFLIVTTSTVWTRNAFCEALTTSTILTQGKSQWPRPTSYLTEVHRDKDGSITFFERWGQNTEGEWGHRNGLWRFKDGSWECIRESSKLDAKAEYGQRGKSDAKNFPNLPLGSGTVHTKSGTTYFFGGASGKHGPRGFEYTFNNEFWAYDGKGWTFLSGSIAHGGKFHSDEPGVHTPNNTPKARSRAQLFEGKDGHIYLFGGWDKSEKAFDDFWRFDGKSWALLSGNKDGLLLTEKNGYTNGFPRYGETGKASLKNTIGVRYDAFLFNGKDGETYLFGGFGIGANREMQFLSDLWRHTENGWTFMGGLINAYRWGKSPSFGGKSHLFVGPDDHIYSFSSSEWASNHVWRFSFNRSRWEFFSDGKWGDCDNKLMRKGHYGVMGKTDPKNSPPIRTDPRFFQDKDGAMYLFGGYLGRFPGDDPLNDLWRFDGKGWVWISGGKEVNAKGQYGKKGEGSFENYPSAEVAKAFGSLMFKGTDGKMYLYGSNGNVYEVWRFDETGWAFLGNSSDAMSAIKPQHGSGSDDIDRHRGTIIPLRNRHNATQNRSFNSE